MMVTASPPVKTAAAERRWSDIQQGMVTFSDRLREDFVF